MSEWVELLRRALESEFHGKPRIASLASVDCHQHPRARSIVVRRLENDGSLWFCTDGRSDKVTELAQTPFAEVVFWLPTLREQFRIAGAVEVVEDERRNALWDELSEGARAMFFWPPPGELCDETEDRFLEFGPSGAPIPESFAFMIVRPDRVEQLVLTAHPHRRLRWNAASSWRCERINP